MVTVALTLLKENKWSAPKQPCGKLARAVRMVRKQQKLLKELD